MMRANWFPERLKAGIDKGRKQEDYNYHNHKFCLNRFLAGKNKHPADFFLRP
jgi:hypothetical protein